MSATSAGSASTPCSAIAAATSASEGTTGWPKSSVSSSSWTTVPRSSALSPGADGLLPGGASAAGASASARGRSGSRSAGRPRGPSSSAGSPPAPSAPAADPARAAAARRWARRSSVDHRGAGRRRAAPRRAWPGCRASSGRAPRGPRGGPRAMPDAPSVGRPAQNAAPDPAHRLAELCRARPLGEVGGAAQHQVLLRRASPPRRRCGAPPPRRRACSSALISASFVLSTAPPPSVGEPQSDAAVLGDPQRRRRRRGRPCRGRPGTPRGTRVPWRGARSSCRTASRASASSGASPSRAGITSRSSTASMKPRRSRPSSASYWRAMPHQLAHVRHAALAARQRQQGAVVARGRDRAVDQRLERHRPRGAALGRRSGARTRRALRPVSNGKRADELVGRLADHPPRVPAASAARARRSARPRRATAPRAATPAPSRARGRRSGFASAAS